MATTITPPAPSAAPISNSPTITTTPAAPSLNRESISDRLAAKLAGTPAPVPATPEAPASPQVAPAPAPVAPSPAQGQDPQTESASAPKTVDEIDFEESLPPTQAPAAPTPTPTVAPAPGTEDPAALVTRVATDLGVAPEVLTASLTGRQMLAAYRRDQALLASDDKGGIGYLPSVKETKDAFQAAAALDGLDYELETNPGSVVVWATTTQFDPTTGRYTPRPGLDTFLDSIPQTLQQLDPRLYVRAARPYLSAAANELYSALQSGAWANGQAAWTTPEDKSRLQDLAENFEMIFLNQNRLKTPKMTPAMQAQQEELNRAQAQQNQADQSLRARRVEAFQGSVFTGLWDSVSADAQTLIDQTGNTSSAHIDWVKEKAIEEAVDRTFGNEERGIPPANPLMVQRYKILLGKFSEQAKQTRQSPASLVLLARRLVQPNLKAILRERLSQQVEKTQTQSTQAHTAAAAGAQRIEPQGTGSAKPQSVAQTPAGRQPGEDTESWMSRRFAETINLAGMQGKRV